MKHSILFLLLLQNLNGICQSDINDILAMHLSIKKEYKEKINDRTLKKIVLECNCKTENVEIYQTFYEAELVISNKSDQTAYLLMWSCYYPGSFLLNNNSVNFTDWICDRNVETTRDIPAKGSITLKILFSKNPHFLCKENVCSNPDLLHDVRIGYRLKTDIYNIGMERMYYGGRKPKKIDSGEIWSNSLDLTNRN